MSEFKLPEKWFVQPNTLKEAQILANYFSDNVCGQPGHTTYNEHADYVLRNGLTFGYGYNKSFFATEITFEEFKKYVLKEEEFKVGDWVYTTSNLVTEDFPAQVVQIDEINEDKSRFIIKAYFKHIDGKIWLLNTRWFNSLKTKDNTKIRKATQEEINMVAKKEFTIQDLAEGRCAVHNDGTLDELKLVLNKAFPSDPVSPGSRNKFYYAVYNQNNYWTGSSTTDKPHQSVKTFIKNMSTTKKIIGYYLAKLEYKDAAVALTGFDDKITASLQGNIAMSPETIDKLRKAGVLDLWFNPVYEETAKIFKMTASNGNFELEVSEKGIYYRPDTRFLNSDDLRYIVAYENFTIRTSRTSYDYSAKVKKIDVGCKEDTLISEWKAVLDYYKTIKKD